jgi:hypothetical protein
MSDRTLNLYGMNPVTFSKDAFELLIGREFTDSDLEELSPFLRENSVTLDYLKMILESDEFRARLDSLRFERSDVIHYFNHLAKTGGTSLIAGVTQSMSHLKYRNINFRELAKMSTTEMARQSFLTGHIGQSPLVQFPQLTWKMYGLWRDPNEWWASYYHQCRRTLELLDPQHKDSEDVRFAHLSFSDWIRLDLFGTNLMFKVWMRVGTRLDSARTDTPQIEEYVSVTRDIALKFVAKFELLARNSRCLDVTNRIRSELGMSPLSHLEKRNVGAYSLSMSDSDIQYLKTRHVVDYWFDDVMSKTGDLWRL